MPGAIVAILAPIGGALGATSAVAATIIGGAVVGAAVGAIVSAVKGGSILKGALIGALAGATVGGVSALLAPEAISAAGAKMSAAAGQGLSTLEATGSIEAGSAGGGLSTLEGAGGIDTVASNAPTLGAGTSLTPAAKTASNGWGTAVLGGIGNAAGGVATALASEDEAVVINTPDPNIIKGRTGQFTARAGSPIAQVQGNPAAQLNSDMVEMQGLVSRPNVVAPSVPQGLLSVNVAPPQVQV